MKLKELINSNHWLSVELTLLQIYPDQKEINDKYKKVFEKLLWLEAEDYDMSIVLTECHSEDESEGSIYVEVTGIKSERKENAITVGHALDFVEWKYWLGMDLAPETINNFTDLEIIAHCLYEMTFFSFEESEIKEQFDTLKKIADEYDKMSGEELKKSALPFEEFFKRLDELGRR